VGGLTLPYSRLRAVVQVDIADKAQTTAVLPLDSLDLHRPWLQRVQPIETQREQVVQQGHQIAVRVDDPGKAFPLDGVGDPPQVGRKDCAKNPWGKHGAGLVGHIVEGPDQVHADILQVAHDGDRPICIAPQHCIHQARA
jgi:hypothetical protein